MKNLMKFDEVVRAAFENDQSKLMAFSKLMIDAKNGVFEAGITAKDASDKIVSIFRNALGLSENASKAEVRKAIRRNQDVLFALSEDLIEDMLVTGWQENPFFMEYVDVRNLALGDENIFTMEDDSLLSVSRVADGHWNIDRQRLGKGRSFSVETATYGIGIYSEYERLLTNAEDFATFVTKIYEAIDRFVNESIYQAFKSAAEQLPGGASGAGQWVKTSDLSSTTKDTFMQLIEDVQMATGREVVIMGTKVALSKLEKIQDINWVSDAMKQERHTTGRIGLFDGIRLVELKQGFALNDTTNRLIDDKQLFIMPVGDNKFVKVVNVGDQEMRQTADMTSNQDQTYDYRLVFRMGVAVQIGLMFGVWNLA